MVTAKGTVYGGVSDTAVQKATGRTWKTWLALLDRAGARKMSHRQIAAVLSKKYDVRPWWQQMIAVGYEQARGLRKLHERPDGYQVGASRTLEASVGTAYEAWIDTRRRGRWLPRAPMEITKASARRTLRIRWGGAESRVDVAFANKGRSKGTVSVTHRKLPSATDADRMKVYWQKALIRLQNLLA